MTFEELKTRCDEQGIPYAYGLFKKRQEPPHLVAFETSSENFIADNRVYKKIKEMKMDYTFIDKNLEEQNKVEEFVKDGKIRLVAVGTLKESKGYRRLLRIIKKVKEEMQFELYAYCLMSNHVHLFLKEKESGDIKKTRDNRDVPVLSSFLLTKKIKLVILTEEGDENEQAASCNK